jgi:hypothetical protein
MSEDEFDAFLATLAPMSEGEKRETLLTYFNAILRSMSSDEIRALREHYAREFPCSAEQTMFFEVIDGHLALRSLSGRSGGSLESRPI